MATQNSFEDMSNLTKAGRRLEERMLAARPIGVRYQTGLDRTDQEKKRCDL